MRFSRPSFPIFRPVLASALLALTLTAACGRGDAETPPEKDDLVVARVLDRSVWASDVRREATAVPKPIPGGGQEAPRRSTALDAIAADAILFVSRSSSS